MKTKNYIAPRIEVMKIEFEGCLAASTDRIPVGGEPATPATRHSSWSNWANESAGNDKQQ